MDWKRSESDEIFWAPLEALLVYPFRFLQYKNLISFISFHKKADAPLDITIETMDIILLIDHRKSRSYPLFSRQILSVKNWEALILPFLVTLQESLKFLTILYS